VGTVTALTDNRPYRSSILYRLTLFFVIILLLGLFTGGYIYRQMQVQNVELTKKDVDDILQKLRLSVLQPYEERRKSFKNVGYLFIENPTQIKNIMKEVPSAPPEGFASEIVEALNDGRMKIGMNTYRSYVYIPRSKPPFMVATAAHEGDLRLFVTAGALFILLLLLLYFSIVHSLLPLKRLARAIRNYGETGAYLSNQIEGNNEIAYVGRAFDEAVRKNRSLMEARHLFLRNVMHELKTPITSGKIALAMIDDGREKEVLDRSYKRLEHLIEEMARVEQVTSQLLKPQMTALNVDTIIFQAAEELMVDQEAITCKNTTQCHIKADEGMMYAIFKNLIDNAAKYASDGKVEIRREKDHLFFINAGEVWPENRSFSMMLEPFVHQNGVQRARSFGLGLYIVNAMLNAQGLTFAHEYQDGYHRFSIGGLIFESCKDS
jgi:two-component system, OmpR family, sensor kinase